jgi:hypothetical protein
MLKNPADYDASLEVFSRPLMPLVEYTLDEDGRMTVQNETAVWYRYMDMTPQAEALFRFIEQTIDTELAGELAFIANYDKTKKWSRRSFTCPTGRSIFSFVSASKTTGNSLRGNARATSASCRMKKSSAWNKPFNLPMETPPQVLNKEHEGNRRGGSVF